MVSITGANLALSILQQTAQNSGGFDFSAIYGGSQATSVYGAGDVTVALVNADTNEAKQLEQTAKDPGVQRDLERYRKVAEAATSIDDILDDPIARKVLLTANGLGDQVDYVGLAKKALKSDPNDGDSLANKLAEVNGAWLTFAKTYNIAENGIERLTGKHDGLIGQWKLTTEQDGEPQDQLLAISKTDDGWKATVDGKAVPVTVDGNAIALDLLWTDAKGDLHARHLDGEISGDKISGLQADSGVASGEWSAKPYYADAIDEVSQNYIAEKRLDMLDEQLPGLGSAVLFKEMASTLDTAIKILGSKLGREVVTTALGLPKEIAIQSLEAQRKAIESRMKPEQLKDPAYVDRMVQRYLIQLNGGDSGLIA